MKAGLLLTLVGLAAAAEPLNLRQNHEQDGPLDNMMKAAQKGYGKAAQQQWNQKVEKNMACLTDQQWNLKESEEPVPKVANPPSIEAWYVNADEQKARANCISKQLNNTGLEPFRFKAVKPPRLGEGDYDSQMAKSDIKDCVPNGVDWFGAATHGSSDKDQMATRQKVVANWCSHKRLFEILPARPAEYFLVLEDDAVLDTEKLRPVLEDFIVNYKDQDWDVVQIDPFGFKDRATLQGYHRGRPIWKACKQKSSEQYCLNVFSQREKCAQYYGFHAVLMKKSGLENVKKWMNANKAMPIDWMPLRMDRVLSFAAGVSQNPEQKNTGGVDVEVPAYCSKDILKSSIGGNGGLSLLSNRN